MVKNIAGKVGLSAVLAVETGSDRGGWIAQQNEALLEFLERTAHRHNARFSIKNGELIFVRKGSWQTASGASTRSVLCRRRAISRAHAGSRRKT